MTNQLTPYEERRLKNIQDNKKVLAELGLLNSYLKPNVSKDPRARQYLKKADSKETPQKCKLSLKDNPIEPGCFKPDAIQLGRRRKSARLRRIAADDLEVDCSDDDLGVAPPRENNCGTIENVTVSEQRETRMECSRTDIHGTAPQSEDETLPREQPLDDREVNDHVSDSNNQQLAIAKLLQAAQHASDLCLDICLAITVPQRVQFWTSLSWCDDLRSIMRKATNIQARLDKENMDLEMFVKTPEPVLTTNLVDLDDTAGCSTQVKSKPAQISPPCLSTVEVDGSEPTSSNNSDAEDADWIPSDDELNLMTQDIPCSNEDLQCNADISEVKMDGQHDRDAEAAPGPIGIVREHADSHLQFDANISEVKIDDRHGRDAETTPGTDGVKREHTDSPSAVPEGLGTGKFKAGLQSAVNIREMKMGDRQSCNDETTPGTDVTTQVDAIHNNTTLYNSSQVNATQEGIRLDVEKKSKCPDCVYRADRYGHLTLHCTKQHAEHDLMRAKNYKCPECPYCTDRRGNLTRHCKRVHKGTSQPPQILESTTNSHADKQIIREKKFKCTECEYTTDRSDVFKRHQKHIWVHTIEQPFKCEVCGLRFKSKRNLSVHMSIHTNEVARLDTDKRYKCPHCVYSTNRKYHLTRHCTKKQHPGKTVQNPLWIQEPTTLLQGHVRKHSGETFNCDQCSYKTTNKYSLVAHTRTHTGDKPYKCKLCDYKTAHSVSLQEHMRKHTGETFDCDQCSYKTTNKQHLVSHMRTHTGDKPYKCKLCDYKSAHSMLLQRHVREHTGETFDCDQCNYKSTNKQNLLSHMRTHTGDKPFKCKLCNYRSAYLDLLQAHTRKHTGVMLCCQQCSFTTHDKSSLWKHVKTHDADKPYKCELCDYQSAHSGLLRNHIRTHTGKTFDCEQCSYKTTNKYNLTRHARIHTAGDL